MYLFQYSEIEIQQIQLSQSLQRRSNANKIREECIQQRKKSKDARKRRILEDKIKELELSGKAYTEQIKKCEDEIRKLQSQVKGT